MRVLFGLRVLFNQFRRRADRVGRVQGEILVVDDVAEAFAKTVIDDWRNRPGDYFSLVLSGGRSAGRCARRGPADRSLDVIDWRTRDIYWGDERCVPPDDVDSNERLGRESLLERVGTANSVHPMRCSDGADAYHLLVAEVARFDLTHLGLGGDGHTASLFPDSLALQADPGRFAADNLDVHGVNLHPRMTLTFAGIAHSAHVVVTVSGAEKRPILEALLAGADLPAQHIKAGKVTWLVDHAAAPASLLST